MTDAGAGAVPARRDPWFWALVAILAVAVPVLVHQGREQSFFLDEFDFIVDRSLSEPSSLFATWYGHWVTIPAIAYRLLVSVFGIRTYLPYQLLSIAGHLAVVVVTHDLAVARLLSHRMMVMKGGDVIEHGLTDRVLDDPREPYTQLLVSSILQV